MFQHADRGRPPRVGSGGSIEAMIAEAKERHMLLPTEKEKGRLAAGLCVEEKSGNAEYLQSSKETPESHSVFGPWIHSSSTGLRF
jgi:hypothetical protein